jgi:GT2 family glycosyltransferase
MEVSFIIPLYNCLGHTRECLRTLQATLPADLVHEIIFVDDGSTDGTREWLKTLTVPCRSVLNDNNLGFAGACNRAAATAQGNLLFFLNNDLVLQPGWFEPMRSAFARYDDAALVGNVQLDAATRMRDHTGLRFNHKAKPEHDTSRPLFARLSGYRPVPAVTGACFGVRRQRWQALGGFDEGFRNGGEDVDLCLRALAAGHSNYVALRSVVLHHVSTSPGRKLRDEANSRRLMLRWQHDLVPLSARAWSRHFIETHWDQSFVYDDHLGRSALFCWLGMLPEPPAGVAEGVQAAIQLELTRWSRLLPAAN